MARCKSMISTRPARGTSWPRISTALPSAWAARPPSARVKFADQPDRQFHSIPYTAHPSLPATNAPRLRWERSDDAIQLCGVRKLDCFAALAMPAESAHSRSSRYNALRHCEEQGDEAIQLCGSEAGLRRCARNDADRAVSQITCPALSEKISCFLSEAKHLLNCSRLVPPRGARDRHGRGAGCDGRY